MRTLQTYSWFTVPSYRDVFFRPVRARAARGKYSENDVLPELRVRACREIKTWWFYRLVSRHHSSEQRQIFR